MNTDEKSTNKRSASQIQQYIKRVAHHHQVEFILGMQGWLNLQKLLNVVNPIRRVKRKIIQLFQKI